MLYQSQMTYQFTVPCGGRGCIFLRSPSKSVSFAAKSGDADERFFPKLEGSGRADNLYFFNKSTAALFTCTPNFPFGTTSRKAIFKQEIE